MTRDELQNLFPNASEHFLRVNATDPRRSDRTKPGSPAAVLEHRPDDALAIAPPVKAPDAGKFVVRVESQRVNLLDEDNLCEKYVVDGLRYAGIIPCDKADRCRIITTQKKVATFAQEKTRVLIQRLPAGAEFPAF